ncbi:MAG: hypothetical protein GF418_02180 [Chitinivibrionales bacterium]|nr:hypothetical protein [Chitinivibrionales bacterium]MBD3394409.1 hypothetical protein [Chitinivibrionales bacterium]
MVIICIGCAVAAYALWSTLSGHTWVQRKYSPLAGLRKVCRSERPKEYFITVSIQWAVAAGLLIAGIVKSL